MNIVICQSAKTIVYGSVGGSARGALLTNFHRVHSAVWQKNSFYFYICAGWLCCCCSEMLLLLQVLWSPLVVHREGSLVYKIDTFEISQGFSGRSLGKSRAPFIVTVEEQMLRKRAIVSVWYWVVLCRSLFLLFRSRQRQLVDKVRDAWWRRNTTRCKLVDSVVSVDHWLWTHAQRASMIYFAAVFFIGFCFFMAALVGQTAERIFTKLSHVVDIRHHLWTY